MLFLNRKPGERVVIRVGGETFAVVVTECRPGRAVLGFDADARRVLIDREEVYLWKTRRGEGDESVVHVGPVS